MDDLTGLAENISEALQRWQTNKRKAERLAVFFKRLAPKLRHVTGEDYDDVRSMLHEIFGLVSAEQYPGLYGGLRSWVQERRNRPKLDHMEMSLLQLLRRLLDNDDLSSVSDEDLREKQREEDLAVDKNPELLDLVNEEVRAGNLSEAAASNMRELMRHWDRDVAASLARRRTTEPHGGSLQSLKDFVVQQEEQDSECARWIEEAELNLSEGLLGRTLSAAVYMAVFTPAEGGSPRKVAVKLFGGRDEADAQSDIRLALLREAKRWAQLPVHDHIVRLEGLYRTPRGQYGLVMELCDLSLHDLLYRDDYRQIILAREEIFALMRGVTRGLAFLHEQGIIHRDIKPGNVMLWGFSEEGARTKVVLSNVKICDFGLATGAEHSSTMTSSGTLPYMAPEVLPKGGVPGPDEPDEWRGAMWSERADVYALGILFWELLERRHPWHDLHHSDQFVAKVRTEKMRPAFTATLELEQWLSSTIRACWHADVSQRPRAKDVLSTLEHWAQQSARGHERLSLPHTNRLLSAVRGVIEKLQIRRRSSRPRLS